MAEKALTIDQLVLLYSIRSYCDEGASTELGYLRFCDVDWPYLLSLASRHNVLPLIAHRLLEHRFRVSIPESVHVELKRTVHASIRHDVQFHAWMSTVLGIILDAGVTPMMLKGPAVAEQLYPKSYLRLSCDLDLMVRPSELVQSARALMVSAYRIEHHLPAAVDELLGIDLSPLRSGAADAVCEAYSRRHDYHVSLQHLENEGVRLVELHWKPAPRRAFVIDTDEVWNQARRLEIGGRQVYVMSPEHAISYAVFHMLNHGWQEGSLRRLLDLSLMANSTEQLDWNAILHIIRKQSFSGQAYHVLAWARDQMGARIPDSVLRSLSPTPYRMWSSRPARTFIEVVGLDASDYRDRLCDLASEMREMSSAGDRLAFLAGTLLPPADGLVQMRGLPKGWRLYSTYAWRPAAAVFRLVADAVRSTRRRLASRPPRGMSVGCSHEP